MPSTHLYQIFYLHKNQSLNVNRMTDFYVTPTVEMIYSNKISTKEIHQQNYLLKVSQINQKKKVSKGFNNAYKPILSTITSIKTSHLM